MDWTEVVSGAVGGVVGGAIALIGVWLTQRSERKRAHADRIWAEQSAAYAAAFAWSKSCITAYKIMLPDESFDKLLGLVGAPPTAFEQFPFLGEEMRSKIVVYASAEVVTAFEAAEEAKKAFDRAHAAKAEKRDELFAPLVDKFAALQEAIRSDVVR